MKNHVTRSLDAIEPPASFSPPLQALWWLKKGGLKLGPEWERAHGICQADEGTRGSDLAHALAHWIEGDLSNADYWYRRAGETRGSDIASEWTRIVTITGD
jgi:TPR repeat protein